MKMITNINKTNMDLQSGKLIMNKLSKLALAGIIVLASACENYEDEFLASQEQIKALEAELSQAQQSILNLETAAAADQVKLNDLNAQLDQLESDLTSQQLITEEISAQLEEKHSEIDDLLAEIADLQNQIANLNESNSDYETQLADLQNQLEDAEGQIEVVTEEVEVIVEQIVTETEVITLTEVQEVVVTEVVTDTLVITEVVTQVTEVVSIVTEVEEVIVTEVVTETLEVEVEVEVTPLTFVGQGGLSLHSDETLDDYNFVTYTLSKPASATWIDLETIESNITLDGDNAYTVQVVNPVAGDNKVSVRITFTGSKPTEGIVTATISGAYYNNIVEVEVPAENNDDANESDDDDDETEEVVAVVCEFTPNTTSSYVDGEVTWTANADTNEDGWYVVSESNTEPIYEMKTISIRRDGTYVRTTTTTTTYTANEGCDETKETEVTTSTQELPAQDNATVQAPNPNYNPNAVLKNGHYYTESVTSVNVENVSDWSDYGLEGNKYSRNRTVESFTQQTTTWTPIGDSPAIDSLTQNLNVSFETEYEYAKIVIVNDVSSGYVPLDETVVIQTEEFGNDKNFMVSGTYSSQILLSINANNTFDAGKLNIKKNSNGTVLDVTVTAQYNYTVTIDFKP